MPWMWQDGDGHRTKFEFKPYAPEVQEKLTNAFKDPDQLSCEFVVSPGKHALVIKQANGTFLQLTKKGTREVKHVLDEHVVVVVVDRSGSMCDVMETAVDGANKFLSDQLKESSGNKRFVLSFFNEHVVPVQSGDIQQFRPLQKGYVSADGQTALYTAIHESVKAAQGAVSLMKTQPVVTIYILTDGEENCSVHKLPETKQLIKDKRENGWKFFFCGANQDAAKVGETLGISKETCLTFGADKKNVEKVFEVASAAIIRCQRRVDNGCFTQTERDCVISRESGY